MDLQNTLAGLVWPTEKFIQDPEGMVHRVYDAREVDIFIQERMKAVDAPFMTLLKKYNGLEAKYLPFKKFYNQVMSAANDESLLRLQNK